MVTGIGYLRVDTDSATVRLAKGVTMSGDPVGVTTKRVSRSKKALGEASKRDGAYLRREKGQSFYTLIEI